MQIHIKVIGVLLIMLALFHVVFPRYFKWKEELKTMSLINRQMMTTHTFFIALTVFLMGLLCITSSNEILDTNFGRTIALGLGLFWTIRLFFQFFIYSSELWKGKRFETSAHVIFSMLWLYLSSIFLMTGFGFKI
ncbi:hypothetical protein [Sediminibacter sp. Hel_I_10]|uniref:hypothetical protein n=1 Tax=Sediminibacter sp. Hel_I_10 TaxID=1392490 RepID=UPI000478D84F|nr:hypothetical protein [Sediminibacter sp. Hel_I_10]